MSAKIAIVIGDYSNGWNDSIVVQDFLPFKTEDCKKDRMAVMAVLVHCLQEAIGGLVKNDLLNPTPKDTPCCADFENWVSAGREWKGIKNCAMCGTPITPERRKKYLPDTVA